MFSLRQDALLLSLRAKDAFRLIPAAEDRKVWEGVDAALRSELVARAEQALSSPIPMMTASDYANYLRSESLVYKRAYTQRREMLKALALGACAEGKTRYISRVADLIYLIAEESTWNISGESPDYPDFTNRKADLAACETGALLQVCATLCEARLEALSPRVGALVKAALGARLFDPICEAEGVEALALPERDIPEACAFLLTASLLGQQDERRQWVCLRKIFKILENHLNQQPEDGGAILGLEKHLSVSAALCDIFMMLSAASGGEVELRDDPLFVGMARAFSFFYIEDFWFLNPGGVSMKPELAWDTLYRLGESARLPEICGLASYLNRRQSPPAKKPMFDEPTDGILSQMMNALYRSDFLRETARAPKRLFSELRRTGLLAARSGRFYAAISRGSANHRDAGDVTLFLDGQPILIDPGLIPDARVHSVPVISGREQVFPRRASDLEARDNKGYTMLSMNLTGAYPKDAGLMSWQRTWMLTPFENAARLMEVFDFDRTGDAIFRFITPHRPELLNGEARLGPAVLSWTDPLVPRVSEIPLADPRQRSVWGEKVYALELSMENSVPGANYSFIIRPAG